ncbi:MAG: DUF883 domain-containing protein [Gammaproteobacteria bacterium]|nr:MAG: DUF883 domain-containing protein [Gammaproteobacteria bacterium]
MSTQTETLKSTLLDAGAEIKDASVDISKEFKYFVSDIEALLKETASLSGEDLDKAKARITDRISLAKTTLGEANRSLIQQARQTAEYTNQYVHEQPWTVLGAGVAISFLFGLLVARRN